MPNYQLPMGIFDPNSNYARQMAADEEERQRTAQQIVQQMNQQQATPTVTVQQPAQPQTVPMPNNNSLAAKAANVLKPLDDTGLALAKQIAGLKMNYDAAKAAGDAAGMAKAHAGAEALRSEAGRYGVDISRLGANDSTEAYNALIQTDIAKGVSDMANMLSPQEHYAKKFNEYKAQGVSNGRAREMALNDTEAYEGQRQRELVNALSRYGYNDRGEINRYGMQIANLLFNQNPQSVGLIDQWGITPRDQWRFDKNMEVMDKQYGQKLDYGQHQYEWTKDLNNDKFNMQKWVTEYNGNMNLALQKMQQEFQKASMDERIALAKNDPDLFALLNGYGKYSKSSNNGFTKAESQVLQSLENAISQAAQSVENSKSRAEDGEAVESARALMEKLYADGKIDRDTYTVAYDRINQLINNRDRKWQRQNYADKIPDTKE